MCKWLFACVGVVLVAAADVTAAGPPPYYPAFDLDRWKQRVVRRSPAGRVLWTTNLQGSTCSLDPILVWDAARVYAAEGDGVTALDIRTGKVLWKSAGPMHCLLLDGGLLLAHDFSAPDQQRDTRGWLVGRSTSDGKVLFRVRLPAGFQANPIRRVAGLFVVDSIVPGKGQALLFDRKGVVKHRIDREVVDGVKRGKDVVLLTTRDVVRLGPGGRKLWTAPMNAWAREGGLVELGGGDVVAFLDARFSVPGLWVVRLDPATGKVAWRARCGPLEVDRLGDRYDQPEVKAEGGRLRVTSRGDDWTLVEDLDLKTGVRVSRRVVRD